VDLDASDHLEFRECRQMLSGGDRQRRGPARRVASRGRIEKISTPPTEGAKNSFQNRMRIVPSREL